MEKWDHKFHFDEEKEDKEIYQAVISILLENEVELLEQPETDIEVLEKWPGAASRANSINEFVKKMG